MCDTCIGIADVLLCEQVKDGESKILCGKTRPRPGQAGLVSGACWLLAAAHCSVVYVIEFSGNSSPSQGINGTCYLEFRAETLQVLYLASLHPGGIPAIISIVP